MRTSFTVVIGALLTSFTMAIPTNFERQVAVCSSGSPQCCDTDVLGVADLDCEAPPETPISASNFTAICAAVGKIDMYCLLPILEQGLICSKPAGSKY